MNHPLTLIDIGKTNITEEDFLWSDLLDGFDDNILEDGAPGLILCFARRGGGGRGGGGSWVGWSRVRRCRTLMLG